MEGESNLGCLLTEGKLPVQSLFTRDSMLIINKVAVIDSYISQSRRNNAISVYR
jgi:N-dimethylarginine dimethylaminohydrolase